jgi:methyl-accepting chemotaxis protein
LSELQHQAKNHRLTLFNVIDMSLLDAKSFFTSPNKSTFEDVSSAFEDVSPVTFDVSSAFEDVSPLTFDMSSAFEDVSSAFEDVSPLTFNMSLAFEDASSAFEDVSAQISLACTFIFPSNSFRSKSMALSCGAAVSGSGLVSVRRPIPCGFKGAGCG